MYTNPHIAMNSGYRPAESIHNHPSGSPQQVKMLDHSAIPLTYTVHDKYAANNGALKNPTPISTSVGVSYTRSPNNRYLAEFLFPAHL